MANRTMQAKLAKMRRQRRSFPKSYSSDLIHVSMPPNRVMMDQYKASARGLALDPEEELFWDRKLGVQFNRIHSEHVDTPRKQAQRRLDKLRELVEDLPREFQDILKQTKHKRLSLFFAHNDGPCYFVLTDNRFRILYKSKQYPSRSYAMYVYGMGEECLEWKQEFPIPDDE